MTHLEKIIKARIEEIVAHYNLFYPEEPVTIQEMAFYLLVEAAYNSWKRMKNGEW